MFQCKQAPNLEEREQNFLTFIIIFLSIFHNVYWLVNLVNVEVESMSIKIYSVDVPLTSRFLAFLWLF